MTLYSELFDTNLNLPLIPPSEELSEAAYRNCKVDYITKDIQDDDVEFGEDEDDEVEQEQEQEQEIEIEGTVSNNIDNTHNKKHNKETNNEIGGYRKKTSSNWKLMRVIAGAHQGWVRSVAVDPITNKWFATGSSDSTIKVWNLATSELKATITGHIMGVRTMAISEKYPYLFSGSEDKTVRCWDLERTNSDAGCQVRDYHGHVGGIYAMSLHPELDLLFTGGRDSVVRVWDIRSRAQVMVLTGHRSDISSIESQIGDPQIITSSMDSTIRLWDIRKQKTALTMTQHTKSIRLLIMHPQELTICSGDSSGNIKQWLLPGGELLNEFGKSETNKIINTMSVNRSNTLFSGYDNGRMEFYDYVSGELLQVESTKPVPGAKESAIYASTFDMLGLRLISCEGDKSIKIWGEE